MALKLKKADYQIDEQGEWLIGVRSVTSPNCDQRPDSTDIDLLVIHGISLPPKEYGGEFIDQLFTNTLDEKAHPYFAEIHELRVSSHLFIDRKGEVTQYVPFIKRAWHSGESIFNGRKQCNDFAIGIELEGCDDEAYCDVQYQTLAQITNLICQRWQKITKDRIVGHSDIAPGRKTDPGPAFDKKHYFSLLKL
jgi:N-acetyl-anhydromuramoyl-L-alanine amidase